MDWYLTLENDGFVLLQHVQTLASLLFELYGSTFLRVQPEPCRGVETLKESRRYQERDQFHAGMEVVANILTWMNEARMIQDTNRRVVIDYLCP
jgi:hypothetical protein